VAGIRAVIFDLDGVWSTLSLVARGPRGVGSGTGRTWTEDDSRACMGRNPRVVGDHAQPPRGRRPGPEIEAAIVEALVTRYTTAEAPIVPGAPAAAASIAARVPVAIASSAHPAVIEAAVRATGLADVFTVIVSSDDVTTCKPAPDVYLEAARRLGVEPGRCLVLEDSRNGVLAGRAAGMRVVLVPNASVAPGPGVAELADAVVRRLADLPIAALGASA
jgi:HAD superfamily hydrolase (TIGR01509 family)